MFNFTLGTVVLKKDYSSFYFIGKFSVWPLGQKKVCQAYGREKNEKNKKMNKNVFV